MTQYPITIRARIPHHVAEDRKASRALLKKISETLEGLNVKVDYVSSDNSIVPDPLTAPEKNAE